MQRLLFDFLFFSLGGTVVMKMKKGAFTSEENPKLYKYLERGKGTVCHQ